VNEKTDLRQADFFLLALLLLLCALGLTVLRGATRVHPFYEPYAIRQTAWLCVGLVAFFCVLLVDYKRFEGPAGYALYAAHLVALVWLLVAGRTIKGARSWIDLGLFNWQPAETMKIALVLVLAHVLSAGREGQPRGWLWWIPSALLTVPPFVLIAIQPDLGSAAVLLALFFGMLYWAGAPFKLLGGFAALGLGAAAAAYPFLREYQRQRILTFLRPGSDPLGAGYNLTQSKIALGSGQLFGKGFGQGTQTNFEFLPEFHTDWIFASLGEQFGFLGCAAAIALYALIVWRGLGIVSRARDRFGALLAGGLMTIILAHLAINLGMALGLAPVTGLPLPFLSAGGSSLVTNFALFGLIVNIGMRRNVFTRLNM